MLSSEEIIIPPFDRADAEAYAREIANDQAAPSQPQTQAIERLVIQIFGQMVSEGRGAIPLTQEQHERLLVLVEGDYDTFEDPIANSILFKRQKRDLLALSEIPCSRCLGVPQPTEIAAMNQEEIVQVLKTAKDKVLEIMERERNLGMAPKPVRSILENPAKLCLLISLDDAARRISDPQALFSAKEQTIASMTTLVNALKTYLLYKMKTCWKIQRPTAAATDRLFQSSRGILGNLSKETDPEKFCQACIKTALHAAAIERAIEKETDRICLFTKERLDQLHPYLEGLGITECRKLQTPPRGMKERPWTDETVDFHTKIHPFVYLIEHIQEHLKPYLDGTILPETENQSRPELRTWLLPMFRTDFPRSTLTDKDIELFILSAYLREGLGGVTIQPLYETGQQLLDIGDTLRAEDVFGGAEKHLEAYTRALKHALPIDFRSMALTDREIEFLADSTAHVESFVVPPNWRSLSLQQKQPSKESLTEEDPLLLWLQ